MKTVMKMSVIALALTTLTACTDPQTATKALTGAGYSDVKITGYSWFGCGRNDTFSTGFVAKGPTGVSVEGTVCSNLIIKNATIRLN